jgi:hypothetical protein
MSRQVFLFINILSCYSWLPFITSFLFILPLDDEGKSQDVEERKSEDNEADNTPIAASIVNTGLPSYRLSSL